MNWRAVAGAPALLARGIIWVYRHSLSSLFGRTCRHLPTCSEYADEALALHGLWRGGWIAVARFWRCRPFGTRGLDPVPQALPDQARWYAPWAFGHWRRVSVDTEIATRHVVESRHLS